MSNKPKTIDVWGALLVASDGSWAMAGSASESHDTIIHAWNLMDSGDLLPVVQYLVKFQIPKPEGPDWEIINFAAEDICDQFRALSQEESEAGVKESVAGMARAEREALNLILREFDESETKDG